ncbi:hypothetical protein GJU40_19110 [Bacillus lacus]|uniref:Uncharacterized protein n=1 Tax=Metabacillus lacus TaxID=1983721 RepID=A0A7X2J2M2_9BACI|nr:hypothetical protein [Metabacillus lacus]MRX74235.1 hypothetical protein [Metabacillus lacus]
MKNETKKQVQIVKALVNDKINSHEFLTTLLKRLNALEENGSRDTTIKGAVKAYFETTLAEGYDEPLVIELDKLEEMLD